MEGDKSSDDELDSPSAFFGCCLLSPVEALGFCLFCTGTLSLETASAFFAVFTFLLCSCGCDEVAKGDGDGDGDDDWDGGGDEVGEGLPTNPVGIMGAETESDGSFALGIRDVLEVMDGVFLCLLLSGLFWDCFLESDGVLR